MVSVILPFYNAEKFLSEAIQSVLGQTCPDFELILLNDGSTDRSLEIATEFGRKDERVRIITQKNLGLVAALNRAVNLASNEWIVRMDADDVMMANRIERQIDFIQQTPTLAVASSFVYYINASGEVVGKSKSEYTTLEAVASARERGRLVGFAHPAVIMRKSAVEAVGGYRKNLWPAEDVDLWNRLLEKGFQILVQPEVLLKYRIHENSISVNKALFTAHHMEWVKACAIARRSGLDEPTREEFERQQAARPLWERLNSFRKACSKAHYKAAVTAWANRRRACALFWTISTVCLNPKFFLSKLKIKSLGSS